MDDARVGTSKVKRLRSVLQSDLIVEGTVAGDGILEVDGKIVGNIDVDTVIVEKNSIILGDVNAGIVTIIGQVAGSIECKTLVLTGTANVEAERIYCSEISIEEGAWLQGNVIAARQVEGS